MLSLTPPASHSLHIIYSGGVSASGGALGLFSLDVCMCQQGGRILREVIEQGGDLFDFFLKKHVVHRASRVHHFGRVALVRGKSFAWGVAALFLAPDFSCFPSTSSMTASRVTSVFEESCFGF